jgi:hypothetical protein
MIIFAVLQGQAIYIKNHSIFSNKYAGYIVFIHLKQWFSIFLIFYVILQDLTPLFPKSR